jgi:hypothetical protein
MRDVHDFVADHASPPIAFYHDLQEEFAAEMRRTYGTFGAIRYKDHPRGAIATIERVEYDLARFSMPSSRDQVVLQAADLLVWIAQREARGDALKAATRRLAERTCNHLVSRAMSETIVAARVRQNELLPFPFAAEARGRAMLGELERARRERVREVRNRAAEGSGGVAARDR